MGYLRKLRRLKALCWVVLIIALIYFAFCFYVYISQPGCAYSGIMMVLPCYCVLGMVFAGLLDLGKWPVIFSTIIACGVVAIIAVCIVAQGVYIYALGLVATLLMAPIISVALACAIWRWGGY